MYFIEYKYIFLSINYFSLNMNTFYWTQINFIEYKYILLNVKYISLNINIFSLNTKMHF